MWSFSYPLQTITLFYYCVSSCQIKIHHHDKEEEYKDDTRNYMNNPGLSGKHVYNNYKALL